MLKEPTNPIYQGLPENFWLTRSCTKCQTLFTKSDYAHTNYQLAFQSVLKINQLNLEVQVQLTHKSCCVNCLNYLKDLYQTKLKTDVQNP